MTIDEINNKIFDVSIIQKGKEGDTLCFRVTNDILGEFIISNCHYNTDPTFFPNAKNHLNGETILKLSEEIMHNFVAALTICYDDSNKGQVYLRC
jgi:hypothetical protein